jgi:uncharacterized protein
MNASHPRPKILTQRLARVLGLLALLYFAVCVYFWATQVTKVLAPLAEIPTTPERMGLPYREVFIPINDSLGKEIGQLEAFWVPADNPDAPVFLYLHGQDATRGKNLEHTERFHQWGYNVLVIDYRGFAGSYGKEQPSEAKVYEDALAALRYLKNDPNVARKKIFIYGHSLGGAVAIELATRSESSDLAGLIVESTFTSVLDMSALRYQGMLRLLPVSLLLSQKFDSLSKIDSVLLPTLYIHGDKDAKVPFEMTETLYNATRVPKQKCIIEGAGHENCGSIGKVQYRQYLDEFVSACLEPSGPSADPKDNVNAAAN